MKILDEKIRLKDLPNIEGYLHYESMMKAVIDIENRIIALNAELHSDLEQLLLENDSVQSNLYGFNINFNGKLEFESNINFPRNRDAGFLRAGSYIENPQTRKEIEDIVDEWITGR